jgi:hypothetical protein
MSSDEKMSARETCLVEWLNIVGVACEWPDYAQVDIHVYKGR